MEKLLHNCDCFSLPFSSGIPIGVQFPQSPHRNTDAWACELVYTNSVRTGADLESFFPDIPLIDSTRWMGRIWLLKVLKLRLVEGLGYEDEETIGFFSLNILKLLRGNDGVTSGTECRTHYCVNDHYFLRWLLSNDQNSSSHVCVNLWTNTHF